MSDQKSENRIDILWAPWRMAYIGASDTARLESVPATRFLPGADLDCFLCQAAVCEPAQNRQRLVLGATERTLAVLNRYPYNNGHLLVAPKRHIARLDLLTVEERRELFDEIARWTGRLEKAVSADGFNVGLNLGRVAGAGLPGHLHWHIVPRWNGDTNFITTVGSTKVIPQSMEALLDLLTEEDR